MNKREKIVQEQFLDDEEKVIKRLKSVYTQALKDIESKSKALYNDIAALQSAINTEQDAEERARLVSMQQAKIYQKQYQDALKKQVGGILDEMHAEEFRTVSEYLQKCYEDGFCGAMYDLHGQGLPLIFPIDQEAVTRAVQLDSKISKGLYTRLGEDVALLKRKITAQVSRGIATGASFSMVAKQLADYTNIGYNNAVRIARTEGHRIQVQSGMDACYKAQEKGADVVKQWDAALDMRTRESHAMVDGEIRELDETFSNGLRYPGDPNGRAEEVINCRCALLQRARKALDADELETLKERAEYFGLDKTANFEDFKKKYLKASEELTNSGKSAIMYSDKFTPAKTIDEASEYLRSLGIEPSYEYKSVNIDVANMINKEIASVYDTFGNLHEMGVLDNIFVATKKSEFFAAYQRQTATMILNKATVSKKNSLKKMLEEAIGNNEVGFWSTASAEHAVRHELGHAVDYAFIRNKGISNNPKADAITKLAQKITNDCGITHWSVDDLSHFEPAGERISYYALRNDKEFVAESVAEYMNGNPRETAKKVIDILLKEG